jgi:hypothetical protein
MNKLKIFKLRKPTRVVSMLSIGCFSGVTVLSSCAETIDFKTYVLPTVKMFANTENKQYIINDDTSISFNLESIPSGVTPEYPVSGARRQLIREIFQNIAGEYYTKLLQTNHALASHPNLKIKIENAAHEISFEFLSSDHLDSLDQITSDKYPEAYQININDKIQVRAFNEYG